MVFIKKKEKPAFYYLSISLAVLLFLKITPSSLLKEMVDFFITFLPLVIVLAVVVIGYGKYLKFQKENPDIDPSQTKIYADMLRKGYLKIILELLLITLAFYILYSPKSFAGYLGVFGLLGKVFSKDVYFLFIAYASLGVVTASLINFSAKAYLKTRNKSSISLKKTFKNSLYANFFILFFLLISSALAYPGAYRPITSYLENIFVSDAKSSETFGQSVSSTYQHIRNSLSQAQSGFSSDIKETKDSISTMVSRTTSEIKSQMVDDIGDKLDLTGGTLAGDLTVKDNLKVEATAYLASILPSEDNKFSLGSSSSGWENLYIHRMYGSSPIIVGDGSSSHSLDSTGDFIISGILETNGIAYFDGEIILNDQRISGLENPQENRDAATKEYVDNQIGTSAFMERIGSMISPTNHGDTLDMASGAITNIGSLGSFFSATGGLNLADSLFVQSGGLNVVGDSIVTGMLSGLTSISAGTGNLLSLTAGNVFISGNIIQASNDSGLALYNNGSKGIFIDDDGNVGVGTESQSYKLEVRSNSGGFRSVSGGVQFRLTENIGYKNVDFKVDADGNLKITPQGGVIQLDGNVGIGVINPLAKLHIQNNDDYLTFDHDGNSGLMGAYNSDGTASDIKLWSNAGSNQNPKFYIYGDAYSAGTGVKSGYFYIDNWGRFSFKGDGLTIFENGIETGNSGIYLNTQSSTSINFNRNQTNDATLIGLESTHNELSRTLLIVDKADQGFNFNHPVQNNPTIFIHSANQSTTEWISLTHDQTNGVIGTGVGNLVLNPFGNVGIGTTSPNATLQVNGNLSKILSVVDSNEDESLSINQYGAIGLGGRAMSGSFEPLGSVHIVSSFSMPLFLGVTTNESNKESYLVSTQYYSDVESEGYLMLGAFANASGNTLRFGGGSSGRNAAQTLLFYTDPNYNNRTGEERMRIISSGNVGIGTTDPVSKLEVSGGDIRVTGGSFIDDGTTLAVPDYVFEPNYGLMPLSDLKNYITANKHLPGIPDMRDRAGWALLSLQDRDMKLLEKTEENTLYVIDLDSQLATHNSQLTNLRAQSEKLKVQSEDLIIQTGDVDSQVSNLNSQIEDLNSQLATCSSQLAILEDQVRQIDIELINTQLNELMDFMLAINASEFIRLGETNKGNLLLDGKLETEETETKKLAIKIKEKESATIGTSVICPKDTHYDEDKDRCKDATDEDEDGIDEESGKSVSTGVSTSVITSAVTADSKIFITIKNAELAIPVKIGKIENGEGFEIEINEPTESRIDLDWWIVGTE